MREKGKGIAENLWAEQTEKFRNNKFIPLLTKTEKYEITA